MAEQTIDLHTHLLEKDVGPEDYWKSVKKKGLDAVAITEHSYEKPAKAWEQLFEAKPKSKVLVPGMELATTIGHVVCYSEDERIYETKELLKKNLPMEKAIEIAKREGFLLSIAHPWGFSYDSAAYILGERKLYNLVEKKGIGIEAYNGLFGNVSSLFYSTSWVRKPMNFFDFLEKNRIARKTRLSKLATKGKQKLDAKGKELLERCSKPYELAEKARYATAGSDAHKAERIGNGIMKLNVRGKGPAAVLKAVQDKKNVKWIGPYVKETSNGYKAEKVKVKRGEMLSGLKYAAKRAIIKKAKRKKKN